MVKVRLSGVSVEDKKKEFFVREFGKENSRWYATVALDLVDETNGRNEPIAEWFYLIACSPQYRESPFKKGPKLEDRYLVVQNEFNEEEVLSLARKKLDKIQADSWRDFYNQMQEEFLYEDE